MDKTQTAVAICDSHTQAEDAAHKLAHAGFDLETISIVGKDRGTGANVIGWFNAGERARFFGRRRVFWDSMEGAASAGGLSAIVDALTSLGVPKASVRRYATALEAGKFLVIVQGDADAAARDATWGALPAALPDRRAIAARGSRHAA